MALIIGRQVVKNTNHKTESTKLASATCRLYWTIDRDSLGGTNFLFKFHIDQTGIGHLAISPGGEINSLSEIDPVD